MKITYTIEIKGFDNVPHKKDFYRAWLADGSDALLDEARKLIRGERESNRFSSQPSHGRAPQQMPEWRHIGCLGRWRGGSPSYADCHCLEVLQDPEERYFLVDQSEHGDYSGHFYDTIVICEIDIDEI